MGSNFTSVGKWGMWPGHKKVQEWGQEGVVICNSKSQFPLFFTIAAQPTESEWILILPIMGAGDALFPLAWNLISLIMILLMGEQSEDMDLRDCGVHRSGM